MKLPEVITIEEFDTLLKHTKKPHYRVAFKLGFLCGLRVAEVAGLGKEKSKCCNKDLLRKTVRLNGKRYIKKYCSKCDKELTQKEIKRSITEWQIKPLSQENIDRGRGLIKVVNSKGGKDRFVPIPRPLQKDLKVLPIKIKKRALQSAINKISLKALGKKIHFHTLRHSCATYCLKRGVDLKQIQLLLGHSTLNMTGVYLHISPEQLKDKFDEIWK